LLATDVQATFDGDPAATSVDEIIFSYPGLWGVMIYRLAHELHIRDVPLVPRIMSEFAHSRTGIDIHPGATIGKAFFIDHGTGVVIGETSIIGNHVKIYQGVTLGALSTRGGQALRGVKRHPTIHDNVTIYSGASVLGGDTVIGEGACHQQQRVRHPVGSSAHARQHEEPGTPIPGQEADRVQARAELGLQHLAMPGLSVTRCKGRVSNDGHQTTRRASHTPGKPVLVPMRAPQTDVQDNDEVAFLPAVGANLRRLRTRRGLSLERLAHKSGVSRAMLSQVELGRECPDHQRAVEGRARPRRDLLGAAEHEPRYQPGAVASILGQTLVQPRWLIFVAGTFPLRQATPGGVLRTSSQTARRGRGRPASTRNRENIVVNAGAVTITVGSFGT
jgi:serine O-acetyltransferase